MQIFQVATGVAVPDLQGLSKNEEEVTRDVDLEGFVVSGLQD